VETHPGLSQNSSHWPDESIESPDLKSVRIPVVCLRVYFFLLTNAGDLGLSGAGANSYVQVSGGGTQWHNPPCYQPIICRQKGWLPSTSCLATVVDCY